MAIKIEGAAMAATRYARARKSKWHCLFDARDNAALTCDNQAWRVSSFEFISSSRGIARLCQPGRLFSAAVALDALGCALENRHVRKQMLICGRN